MLNLLRQAQFDRQAWDALSGTCTRILAIDPDNNLALLTRARGACETGRTTSAIADLNRVLARDPQHWPALAVRALAYVILDRPTQALADANAAVRAGADVDSFAYQACLLAHVAFGHRGEAEQVARLILQHDPDDDLAHRVIEAVTARRQSLIDTGVSLVNIALRLLGA